MHTQLPLWFETGSLVVLVLILVVDLLIILKRPHVPSMKEAGLWVGLYVVLALVFAGLLFALGDSTHGGEFLAGWLTEYSLSIDNLFVFVLLMSKFSVPKKYQQEVLMVGIIVALICRGAFILLGSAIIEAFVGVFYLFGLFLLYTAFKQAFGKEDDENADDNGIVRFMKKRFRLTDEYDANKLRTTIDGQKYFTPMLLVFIAIGTTDVMFALDSIPAIFGITKSPYLVFCTNLFALMGLRQLYFLLGGLLDALEYLKYGIAAILAFIGVKLILHAGHETWFPWMPDINTWVSLGFIVAALGIATIISLIKMKRTHTTVVFGSIDK
ncbi:TerC family protein [Brevibacterium moorei]|uniref:TerC family protein n=1 Tax=Brevibacterium moorei TaxID=2968457 RepID=UPI00211CCCA7|nr:TerC family protein [Brevibacterium sp. 68QC2CO]MCQ9383989.1 TerC family protein [Brevibacterium sp. 68QC2CO]